MEVLSLMLPYKVGRPGEAKGWCGASLLKLMKSKSKDEPGSRSGTIQKCLPLTTDPALPSPNLPGDLPAPGANRFRELD